MILKTKVWFYKGIMEYNIIFGIHVVKVTSFYVYEI